MQQGTLVLLLLLMCATAVVGVISAKARVNIVQAPAASNRVMTAEGAIECGMKYADLDKDGRLSLREVKAIRDTLLGPVGRVGYWLASKLPVIGDMISVQQIFDDCDYNHDGYITRDDFERMRATCLNTPGKVGDAYKYVCDKGDAGAFKHIRL